MLKNILPYGENEWEQFILPTYIRLQKKKKKNVHGCSFP